MDGLGFVIYFMDFMAWLKLSKFMQASNKMSSLGLVCASFVCCPELVTAHRMTIAAPHAMVSMWRSGIV